MRIYGSGLSHRGRDEDVQGVILRHIPLFFPTLTPHITGRGRNSPRTSTVWGEVRPSWCCVIISGLRFRVTPFEMYVNVGSMVRVESRLRMSRDPQRTDSSQHHRPGTFLPYRRSLPGRFSCFGPRTRPPFPLDRLVRRISTSCWI